MANSMFNSKNTPRTKHESFNVTSDFLNETLNLVEPPIQENTKYKALWKKAYSRVNSIIRLQKLHRSVGIFENPFTASHEVLHNYLRDSSESFTPVKTSFPLFVINPQGKVYLAWLSLISLVLLYLATVDPFLASFSEASNYSEAIVLEVLIDLLFIGDFFASMNLAYYDEDGGLVTSRHSIFFRYLRTWLIFDLISSVPFGLISAFGSSDNETSGLLRLIRLRNIPKLIRLTKLGRMLKSFLMLEDIDYLISKHSKKIRFFKVAFVVFICLHLVACLFYLVAKLEGFGPGTWVFKQKILGLSNVEKYQTSLYWAITTMTTVGYGDIVPVSPYEKILAMLWMVTGVYVISYSVGALTSFYSDLSIKDNSIHHKMLLAEGFASKNGITKEKLRIMKRTIRSLVFTPPRYELENFLDELSIEMKLEMVKSIHQGAICGIPFFKKKDMSFVANIGLRLELKSVLTSEKFWVEKESSNGIYFIIEGRATYVSQGMPFMSIGRGHYFGDIEIMRQSERKFEVRCSEDSKVLKMDNFTVKMIEDLYPKIWLTMKNDSEIRLKNFIQNLSEMQLIKDINKSGRLQDINFKVFKEDVKKRVIENSENFLVNGSELRRMKFVRELDETEHLMRKADENVDRLLEIVSHNKFKF